jgi:hypothetical protein
MTSSLRMGVVAAFLALVGSAFGHGLFHRRAAATTAYYAVPMLVIEAVPVACVGPPLIAEPPVAAVPSTIPMLAPVPTLSPVTPAPPSMTPVPPATRPTAPPVTAPTGPPKVTESQSFYAGPITALDKLVGFWNRSDRDITLTVENAKYWLPRDGNLRFRLTSRFHWQVDDRAAEVELIPATAPGVEIVIRR